MKSRLPLHRRNFRLFPFALGLREQPGPDEFGHRQESPIADSFTILVRDVGPHMTHDRPHGDEVAALITDGLQGVPQRVKIPMPGDLETVEQLAGFFRDRVVVGVLRP